MSEQATVTLMVKPSLDNTVTVLGAEIIAMNIYAQHLTIQGDEDLKKATNDLSLMAGLKKAIEDKRKEYLGPLQHHVKEVNEAFKLLTDPLNVADQTLRGKVQTYRQILEAKRREEERINDLRLEAAHAEQRLKGELSQPVALVEETVVPTRIRTDVGTVGTSKIKKYEIVDFAALPDEYKMPDAAKIGKVVRAGIPSIPGVRIYEEESLRVTPRQ